MANGTIPSSLVPPQLITLLLDDSLLCHATELALKGWLADTGLYTEKMLKDAFGHNLEKLVDEVKQVYGPSPELTECAAFVATLNVDYKGKSYEYPIDGGHFVGT